MKKFSVLYLDLNEDDLIENYSLAPKCYGGGRTVAAHLMPYMTENGHLMRVAAHPRAFEGIEEKYKTNCVPLSIEQRRAIKSGASVYSVLPQGTVYDIILHNFYGVKINLTGSPTKDLVWLVGYGEHVNPANSRVVLYNDYQGPKFYGRTNVYKARIGVPLPVFQEYKKDDYIFSCHRQNQEFGAEKLMQLAHKYKFRYIAAGPRQSDFPNIMDYADGNYVKYLGLISEEEKNEWFKHAKCSTYLHRWNTPFNLSAITSLSYGTPCIASPVGFWPSLIKNGENGFLINPDSDKEFLIALENCGCISQEKCYNTVREYDGQKMIEDYVRVFEAVLKE